MFCKSKSLCGFEDYEHKTNNYEFMVCLEQHISLPDSGSPDRVTLEISVEIPPTISPRIVDSSSPQRKSS